MKTLLHVTVIAVLLFCLLTTRSAYGQEPSWPQWGGPNRNFKVEAKGLPNSWPEKGPRQVWKRELGDGYSGIAAEGDRLYTMYRKGEQDITIALEAKTGRTLWEHFSDAPFLPRMQMENGPGPHSTPLIAGGLLFTIGVTGKLHCFNKENGKVIWFHDLWQEFQGTKLGRGYSPSPIVYKQTIIVTVGGKGNALMAFNQKDGTVVWKNQDHSNAHPSPILINVDGEEQLVVFMQQEIGGFDPNNGAELWRHPHPTQYGLNLSTPVWGEGNLLFCSSAYNGGSRVLQLNRREGKTEVKELWFSNRLRIHIGNAIRIGDYIYGSSGDFGPAFFTAVDIKTGNVVWQDRSLARACLLYADGKFIILDEDGHLALATTLPTGLKIHSKIELLNHNAWTAPTLAGARLYLRDRKVIMAMEL